MKERKTKVGLGRNASYLCWSWSAVSVSCSTLRFRASLQYSPLEERCNRTNDL